jgi:hypothetical protein
MKYEDLKTIVKWLDAQKNPILIQVSKGYINRVKDIYPKLPISF